LSRRRFGTARQGTTRSTAPAQKTLGFSFITKYFLLILDKVVIVRKGNRAAAAMRSGSHSENRESPRRLNVSTGKNDTNRI